MVRAVADKTVIAKPATTMSNILSSFLSPSDDLYWRLQIASLILIGLSVVVGGFTIATGWKINRRQAREIEDLKIKRVELEKSIASRSISVITGPDGKSNADPLKEFAGTDVIIWFIPQDLEARRAAQQLSFELKQELWKVVEIRPDASVDLVPGDGVVIEPYSPQPKPDRPPKEADELQRAEFRSRIVANTLAEFLASEPNNWERVRWSWDPTWTLNPNQLRIKIGSRPMEYFNSLWLPPNLAAGQKSPQEEKEEERQRRQEDIKRDREYLENARQSDELIKKLREKGIIAPEPEEEK